MKVGETRNGGVCHIIRSSASLFMYERQHLVERISGFFLRVNAIPWLKE